MRGSTVRIITDVKENNAISSDHMFINTNSIGKELLYNISMISDISSQDCLKSDSILRTIRSKLVNANSEILNLESQLEKILSKKESLEKFTEEIKKVTNTKSISFSNLDDSAKTLETNNLKFKVNIEVVK